MHWGVATSAYQVEGAWDEGGRAPSVWDTFAHQPGNIRGDANGDVACDMYHRYKEDFKLMRAMGVKHYRFSFSWSRILPQGGRGTAVNEEGAAFYDALIYEMLAQGITPAATMFHWDLPQALQDKYQGPLGPEFVDDFVAYADVLFERYGDRVKHWITFNEPWITCYLSYGIGVFAPGHKGGDPDQYKCGHHLILAHARTKELAVSKYPRQGAKLGMSLNIEWPEPMSDSAEDKAAAGRAMMMQLGWFADPLYFGMYPLLMTKKFADQAWWADFTPEERRLVRGSADFFGINFYTGKYVSANGDPLGYQISDYKDGQPIGPLAQSNWLRVVPESLYKLCRYVTMRYGAPDIWITENGVSAPGEASMPVEQAVHDAFRVDYFRSYLANLCRAKAEGARVAAYYAWSFMDNFEWREGFGERFGIVHVALGTPGLKRTEKDSGKFLEQFFRADTN
ncbi:MAG: beta-glucosidase 1A [Monoraphidium minutum]|nr:MAG: beta-glucosidase 1A [Monoraphidium minutum]